MSLRSMCEAIDAEIVAYFAVLDAVHRKQAELNALMKEGFFLMAKARYSMGQNSVTSLQYSERMMTASMRVQQETGEDDKVCLRVGKFEESEDKVEEGKTEETLRKRHVGSNEDSSGVEEVSKNPTTPTKTNVDPLRWFGVLVPTALRESQAKFRRVSEVSGELATLKIEVDNLRQKCKSRLTEKETLINSI